MRRLRPCLHLRPGAWTQSPAQRPDLCPTHARSRSLARRSRCMVRTATSLSLATMPATRSSPCRRGLPAKAEWQAYLGTLQEWWDAGVAPIFFAHPDGWSFEATRDALTPLLEQPRAQKLIRIVVPSGWEPTRYDWSSCTWAAFARWGRETRPNALILIHTVSDVDAPVGTDARCDDNDHSTGEGWARVTPF